MPISPFGGSVGPSAFPGVFRLADGAIPSQLAGVDATGNVKVVTSNFQFNGASADGISPNGVSIPITDTIMGLWDPITQVVRSARTPTTFKLVNVAIVAGTPATIWTPAAGKKFRLMGWSLGVSAAASIIFIDNAAPGFAESGQILIGDSKISPRMGNGFLSALANNLLKLDVSAAATVRGLVFGTEE